MGKRLDLHAELIKILGCDHVYFQPPESLKIKYPAIVYSLSDISNDHANNHAYKQDRYYMVTYISKEPESAVVDKLSWMDCTKFNRSYRADNLNHTVFTIYY